jgi:hypothetical protein
MSELCLICLILFVGHSNANSLLDEEDMESDTEKNVGDTHIEKRKLKVGPRKGKGKKAKTTDEAVLESDESTPSPDEGRSPPYQESNLSTSASFDDDDGDGGDYRIEPLQPPIQFTGVKYLQIYLYSFNIIFLTSLTHALLIPVESHYTHAAQDMDHGAPHSQRETITTQDRHTSRGRGRRHYLSLVDSSSSQNTGSPTPYAHGFNTYMAPDPSQLVQDVQWVYRYENSELYNMLVQ